MAESTDHQNPKIASRGLRSGVTKLLAEIRGELDKGDDGSKIKLRVYLNRMTEKLTSGLFNHGDG